MWINVNTAGTFILHADIRYELWKQGTEAPGVLTDEYLATVGYMPVTQIRPVYDPITQGIAALPPVSNDGVWEQHFEVYPLDPAIVSNNQAMAAQAAKDAILAQLDALDRKSIRALREGDTERILLIEAQAVALRAQLA